MATACKDHDLPFKGRQSPCCHMCDMCRLLRYDLMGHDGDNNESIDESNGEPTGGSNDGSYIDGSHSEGDYSEGPSGGIFDPTDLGPADEDIRK